MTAQGVQLRRFTAWTASSLVAGVTVLLIGGAFLAEGLLGYFYNSSMFWEGLDHIWEIYGGLATALVGTAVAILSYVRR